MVSTLNDALALQIANEMNEGSACPVPEFPVVAGKSAYELALETGFVGSLADYLVSLVGPKGEPGEPGSPGSTGDTGAPGENGESTSLDMQFLLDFFLPPGSIIEFGTGLDPNTKYNGNGFASTWVRHGEGKAAVGLSVQSADPVWTKSIGNTFGKFSHVLTVEEMPSHGHEVQLSDAITSAEQTHISAGGNINGLEDSQSLQNAGGGQAHNNVQPSIVDARWRRTV